MSAQWHNLHATSPAYYVEKLFNLIQPRTVLDVGCNRGYWLHEFKARGCDVIGIDLLPYDHNFRIKPTEYVRANVPTFDGIIDTELTVCVEVAEHIDARYADHVMELLTGKAKACLFSAATPGQGGDGHVNEQPDEYWRGKFLARGWERSEDFHKWTEDGGGPKPDGVYWWYHRNIRLYMSTK